jgi:tetratricopeptide (TPR) repeat protein
LEKQWLNLSVGKQCHVPSLMQSINLFLFLCVLTLAVATKPTPCSKRYQSLLQNALEKEDAGELGEALDVLNLILEEDPSCPEALASSGYIYMNMEDMDKSIEYLGKAVKAAPNDAALVLSLGAAQMQNVR